MQVRYDRQLNIAGMSGLPWLRLGAEQWFDNYKIISRYGWGTDSLADVPPNFNLNQEGVIDLPRLKSQGLLNSPAYQRLLKDAAPDHYILPYRTVRPPAALEFAGCRFLGIDIGLVGKLENKAAFRDLFAREHFPFPRYRIIERHQITPNDKGLSMVLDGQSSVILQDERLSGGQGTFLIRTRADLVRALEQLQALSQGRRVVVSEYITDAVDRTVQACVTRYGVFVGPLQKQIIGHPLLSNLKAPGTGRYCGGEIGANDRFSGAWDDIRSIALRVGTKARELGYRGIFGMDFMVNRAGRVFVLEMNPRMVGITPLLTMRYRSGQDIPFLLLHILELADVDYEITDPYIAPQMAEGGLLICHAWKMKPTYLTSGPMAGLYSMHQQRYLEPRAHFDADVSSAQLLVQPATFDRQRVVKPGARMSILMTNSRVLDGEDNLTVEAKEAVEWLQERTVLEEV